MDSRESIVIHGYMRLNCLFTVLLAFGAGSGVAQVKVDSLTVADGLSQGYPTSIIQDRKGYIWIGTFDGLNRYDGYKVKRYTIKPFDPWSLQTSLITSLYEDYNGLMWVGTHHGLYAFDPLSERFYFIEAREAGFSSTRIHKVVGDKWGHIFVLTSGDSIGQGAYRLDIPPDFVGRIRKPKKEAEQIKAYPIKSEPLSRESWAVFDCIGDTMLLATGIDQKIYRYTYAEEAFKPYDPRGIPRGPTIAADILWGVKWGYLFRWNDPVNAYVPVSRWLHILRFDRDKIGVWLYDKGPFVRKNDDKPLDFNAFLEKQTLLKDVSFKREFTQIIADSLFWNNKMLGDRTSTIWLGTSGWGLRKINTRQLPFHNALRGNSISSIRELPDGKLWIRFYSDASIVFDPQSGKTETLPWPGLKWINEVKIDRLGNSWIIMHHNPQNPYKRLLFYEKATGRVKRFEEKIQIIDGVPEKILEDRDGNIWIAAHGGDLFRCRPGAEQLEHFSYAGFSQANPLSSFRATSILQDARGIIWLTTSFGVVRMDDANGASPRFTFYSHNPDDPHSLNINWVTCVCPDPAEANTLWFGTKGGGLNRFDLSTQQFSYIIASPEGLPDNVVYGILPDDEGNLWCSTNRGLCRYNPVAKTFASFMAADGLLSDEFNTHAYLRTRDGRLWFGGVNGLDYFRAEEIRSDGPPPQLAITGIKVRGAERSPDEEGMLTLPYAENNVLFEFAVLDFANPGTNRFRHRLRGLEESWVYDGTQHQANYAALPPGTYVFEVQGATSDGPWSDKIVQFKLVIRAPFYMSWLAYLLYITAICLLIWGIVRYRVKMIRLEESAIFNRLESERLKDFEAVKNQFFTNLAHELRTPLTVILGLANRLRQDARAEAVNEHAQNIADQGSVLLQLTDQILDLAKLESRHFQLQISNSDMVSFVRQHTTSMMPLAVSKGLELIVESSISELVVGFDPIQLKKILNNLISNAIRHSSADTVIKVILAFEVSNRWLKIIVQDQGEGIQEEDLPQIFERYYQGSVTQNSMGSAGLGLTLSRDLARLMGGDIQVESVRGEGSTFTVLLPITVGAALAATPTKTTPPEISTRRTPGTVTPRGTPTLLIIEDNASVAAYLRLCLQEHYQLIYASDGEAGINKALEQIPDLIITDVAMPNKNGFEVVSVLKEDARTSHIPIVILSAKVEHKDRLEGNRRGANAYLTKPFSEEELLYILANLLHLQTKWKERYAVLAAEGNLSPADEIPAYAVEDIHMEDAFMVRLYGVFEAHYTEELLNLDRLCRVLNMSSSQLDRKLKALTDQTPMQLLRKFRLRKARHLLQSELGLSIKDVCFRTGFKSPAHFSRAFAEEFGVPPSGI